jgi:hypothetical protein
MRARLPHTLAERRHARRHRARAATPAFLPAPPPRACDPAVARVREAGGPVDQASYTCDCGYLFRATVSTSVTCPHCGSGQAW